MEKVILIRFGEIFLKGKNRGFFEKALLNNIKKSLESIDAEVVKVPGRYMIQNYSEDVENEIVERLSKVAGIFSFSTAIYFDTSLENITTHALEMMSNLSGTFKVSSNRADKTFELNSMELSREIGGRILSKNRNLKVEINKPDYTLNIDLRENGKTFMFEKTYMGVGGMPVGTSGSGLVLLSGGIDSPVAVYI